MKTNRKKSFSHLLFFLLLLVFLALFAFLGIRSFYRANYMPEPCTESADELSNPYIGFYHMYGYVLGSDTLSNLPAASDNTASDSDAKNRQGIVMLEVNLQNFSNEDLSDSALSQLDTILSAWKKHGSQVILRFLYDWDGKAMETEPQSLEQILRHMDQTAEVVNRYTDCVFLMQGIFVGNCGEMNNSHYMSDEDCTTLMHHLAEVTDPSVFLSVRTPVQRRKILDSSERPTKETAFDGSLSSRLGLFNDGMLGTANDTGTYGDTAASADTYRSAWVREDELSFQNELCNFVPNGGEVTLDNPLNDLAHAIQDLSRMHVSYLNSEHDPAVLDKWKAAAYKDEASVFNGLSGYDYIERHLGYRYVIQDTDLDSSDFQIRLENVGFSVCYRKLDLQLTLVSSDGEVFSFPISSDSRFWIPGTTAELSISLPLARLAKGSYTVYFQMTDPVLQREILPANTFSHDTHGFSIGTLEISKLY